MRKQVLSGFTIIELMVVIAVIGVVVSLLLPALSKARAASRISTCLSNHKQLAIAWIVYTNDHKVFPYGDDISSYRSNERAGWGGVNWYQDMSPNPSQLPVRRPLNPYLGGEYEMRSRMDVVYCPSDDGVYNYNTKKFSYETPGFEQSQSPSPRSSYGVHGTSYMANDWQYCRPGARQGWGPPPAFVNYRSNLGPQHVTISPSRFMIFGDTGTYGWIMSTEQQRTMFVSGLSGSWWHGKEVGTMSFLDGSARLEKSGRIVNSRYSMYMVPISNPNRSTDFRFPGAAFP